MDKQKKQDDAHSSPLQGLGIKPAERLNSVSEYYFSAKLREVAEMNVAGKNVINLGIGNPDLPPSEATIMALNTEAKKSSTGEEDSR